MSTQTKLLSLVFFVALLIRLVVLETSLPKMKSDVDIDGYHSLARNLVAGKGFVSAVSEGHEVPNVARTPVYPLFLAAFIQVCGDRLGLFLLAQCVLGAMTCVLTVLLCARWLSWRGATAAGLLMAIDPNSVLRCSVLMTETLFTLLFITGVCVLVWRPDRVWGWLLTGFLWSVAALCRPIAVWLWLIALLFGMVRRTRLVLLAFFFVGFLPLISLWAVRNVTLTGRWFVSTIATYNLLVDRVASIEAEKTGESFEAVQKKYYAQYRDLEFFQDRDRFDQKLREAHRVVWKTLTDSPLLTAKHTFMAWAKVLIAPGKLALEPMLKELGTPARWWPSLYSLILVAAIFLGLVAVKRLKRDAMFLMALILYFVVPAAISSRFRTPITPILVVLAVVGCKTIRHWKSNGDATCTSL